MVRIIISGVVSEIRTYQNNVILFLKCSASIPSLYLRDRTVLFTLNPQNCDNLLRWVQLAIGTEITISRSYVGYDAPKNLHYALENVKSDVVDASLDLRNI